MTKWVYAGALQSHWTVLANQCQLAVYVLVSGSSAWASCSPLSQPHCCTDTSFGWLSECRVFPRSPSQNKMLARFPHPFTRFKTLLLLLFILFWPVRDFKVLLLLWHFPAEFSHYRICTNRFDCGQCKYCRGTSRAATRLNSS